MVDMSSNDKIVFDRQSSKGNQLKFCRNNLWYKCDYTGYEGIAEYVVSAFLSHSTLDTSEYVSYQTEQIQYAGRTFLGCISEHFLSNDDQIITLERLYKNKTGHSLYKEVWSISDDIELRLDYLVGIVENITGLHSFGIYMAKLITIDALFLNEDRHFHNIAVILREDGTYALCPIFDQGAALLSDTRMDYPMDGYLYDFYDNVKSKTISSDFIAQLDAADSLYGEQIHFSVSSRELEDIVDDEPHYPSDVKKRVKDILFHQRSRYEYLFK